MKCLNKLLYLQSRLIIGFVLIKKIDMVKEIRKDLFTQAAYAEKVGKTRAWVNQKIKANEIPTLNINGATLIKAVEK